ncbi:hypothetical protein KPH14_005127 [Odynerus spinipes]|uniref:HMG box domain-containing protein n=1 Tax=Odynerus spinipes TaxID=1348599 RepID=A0AAD9RKR3_9HYME|nr:hypothetical protein KPH14_005127 [Odynerus spinipes]
MENVENFHTGEKDRHDIQDDLKNERPNNEEEPVVEKHGHRGRSARGKCRCKSRRRKRKLRLSRNPFIIFYLEMFFKSNCKRVVEVAREAGKKWCALPDEKKEKYIRLARKLQCRKS